MLQINNTNVIASPNLSSIEMLELSKPEVTSYIASICEKSSCKTVANLLHYIKQSELEADLAMRYCETPIPYIQLTLSFSA